MDTHKCLCAICRRFLNTITQSIFTADIFGTTSSYVSMKGGRMWFIANVAGILLRAFFRYIALGQSSKTKTPFFRKFLSFCNCFLQELAAGVDVMRVLADVKRFSLIVCLLAIARDTLLLGACRERTLTIAPWLILWMSSNYPLGLFFLSQRLDGNNLVARNIRESTA